MNLKLKGLLAANSPSLSFVFFPHGAQAVGSCPRSWVARPSGRDVPSNDWLWAARALTAHPTLLTRAR